MARTDETTEIKESRNLVQCGRIDMNVTRCKYAIGVREVQNEYSTFQNPRRRRAGLLLLLSSETDVRMASAVGEDALSPRVWPAIASMKFP